MMEFLFLDLDDTILDFHKAERIALSKTLTEFGVEPAEEVLSLYHRINLWHWEQLEQGKLTREEVLAPVIQLAEEGFDVHISFEERASASFDKLVQN